MPLEWKAGGRTPFSWARGKDGSWAEVWTSQGQWMSWTMPPGPPKQIVFFPHSSEAEAKAWCEKQLQGSEIA